MITRILNSCISEEEINVRTGSPFAHPEQADRRRDDQEGEGHRGKHDFFLKLFKLPSKIPQCAEAAAHEDKFDTENSQNLWTMRHPIQMFAVSAIATKRCSCEYRNDENHSPRGHISAIVSAFLVDQIGINH